MKNNFIFFIFQAKKLKKNLKIKKTSAGSILSISFITIFLNKLS